MRWKTLKEYCRIGFNTSQEMQLNKEENWTALLIYIHVSRIIIGSIFGLLMGFVIGFLVGKF